MTDRSTGDRGGVASLDGHVVVSLGVGDIDHATQFYCDGLGFGLERAEGPFAAFAQPNGASGLALYSGDPLSADARVVADRGGYRGVSLAYVVDSPERVDEVMARAERAGATVLERAHRAEWGGYLGYFADPDGNFWKVVVGRTG